MVSPASVWSPRAAISTLSPARMKRACRWEGKPQDVIVFGERCDGLARQNDASLGDRHRQYAPGAGREDGAFGGLLHDDVAVRCMAASVRSATSRAVRAWSSCICELTPRRISSCTRSKSIKNI